MRQVTLYHGTSDDSAEAICSAGWQPNAHPAGSHQGNPALLYLTTTPENALWYANEKGSAAVIEVILDLADLVLDPEDALRDTVEDELNSTPGNVATSKALPSSAFRLLPPETKYQI